MCKFLLLLFVVVVVDYISNYDTVCIPVVTCAASICSVVSKLMLH